MASKTFKTMWLIEWVGTNKQDSKVIGFLRGSISTEKIAEYIERVYLHSQHFTLEEKLYYGHFQSKTPYKATGKYGVATTCGHNPFVSAILVSNVRVVDNQLKYDKYEIPAKQKERSFEQ